MNKWDKELKSIPFHSKQVFIHYIRFGSLKGGFSNVAKGQVWLHIRSIKIHLFCCLLPVPFLCPSSIFLDIVWVWPTKACQHHCISRRVFTSLAIKLTADYTFFSIQKLSTLIHLFLNFCHNLNVYKLYKFFSRRVNWVFQDVWKSLDFIN